MPALAFCVRGSSKTVFQNLSQKHTYWTGNSRISFLADISLHNKTHRVQQWNLMIKMRDKIFLFTRLLHSLCDKSNSIFLNAFHSQCVAISPSPTFAGSMWGSTSNISGAGGNTWRERESDGRFTFDSCMEPWSQWQPSWTIPCPPSCGEQEAAGEDTKWAHSTLAISVSSSLSYLHNIIIYNIIFANRKENQVKRVGFLIQTTFLFRGQILVLWYRVK